MLRSALIVAVPEAAAVVDAWRERTSDAKPSAGVPAHVTVLFPFVPAASLDERIVAELRALFAGFAPFAATLARCARFAEVLYLEPEPAEPFVSLTHAVATRFPEYPPYEGAFDDVVPHLTVAEGASSVLDAAEADVRRQLPVTTRVAEVVLLEEVEPDSARWRARSRLPLGTR